MSFRNDSMGGYQFVDDIIQFFNDNWFKGNGGKLPNINVMWEIKTVGFVNTGYEEIIISFDSENKNIYSLLQSDNGKFFWDWLNEISITVDMRTGKSLNRLRQITNEVTRILSNNVITPYNNTIYVQTLPSNLTPLNDDYRNLFRNTLDVDTMIFNPVSRENGL